MASCEASKVAEEVAGGERTVGGVPPMVEKRADAGSRDGILCGRHDRLVDHLLLEW
jgi:hypothetical protein